MIDDWVLKDNETAESHPWKISDAELQSQRDKVGSLRLNV